MIEYTIIFGLGFLSASLLALMLAPAIHRRIVAYTEKRIFATMPISPAEVRAQKDMARALYATENAKLRSQLEDERKRSISLRVRHDDDQDAQNVMERETQTLKDSVEVLTNQVVTLETKLEEKKAENEKLVGKLQISEELAAERAKEITKLSERVKTIAHDLNEVKIALAAREVDVENERSKAKSDRATKDAIAKQLQTAEVQNKEAANKITSESRKVTRLEQQLAAKAAQDADTEMMLERRAAEIARLKERLRTSGNDNSSSKKLPKADFDSNIFGLISEDDMSTDKAAQIDIDELHAKSRTLTERLKGLKDNSQDEALREELANLAAEMVALTAQREGANSPIHQILAKDGDNGTAASLASRAKQMLESTR